MPSVRKTATVRFDQDGFRSKKYDKLGRATKKESLFSNSRRKRRQQLSFFVRNVSSKLSTRD